MRRREFILALGGSAPWPVMPRAQQPSRIGYLSPIGSSTNAPRREAFLLGLREHGYVVGQNVLVEWRFAEGNLGQLLPLAAELVQLKVHAIIAADDGPVARNVMGSIPIVMTNVEDPVRRTPAPWLACAYPCRRFACTFAGA
jgi:putative tryptophan/tyrosine transport system substrate-binding protein